MATKKKSKTAAVANDGPPDPRAALPCTPANLAAALKQLKAVLAVIPEPEPIIEEPVAEEPGVDKPGGDKPGGEAEPANEVSAAAGQQQQAAAVASADGATTEGGAADGKTKSKTKKAEPIVRLPQLDLVDALLHLSFAQGLPCGYGQEALRRIAESFVDRNEFRVTEAFEVEELLQDLEIPDLFERCQHVRDSIAQIYNDQNGVSLAFLREAGISDRNMFFQRVPAVPQHVITFLTNLLTMEEICFSEKSTTRAQQRFGLEPSNSAVSKWVDEVRACLKPYGHLPLSVGAQGKGGKPNLEFTLSPASILTRLGPPARGKKR